MSSPSERNLAGLGRDRAQLVSSSPARSPDAPPPGPRVRFPHAPPRPSRVDQPASQVDTQAQQDADVLASSAPQPLPQQDSLPPTPPPEPLQPVPEVLPTEPDQPSRRAESHPPAPLSPVVPTPLAEDVQVVSQAVAQPVQSEPDLPPVIAPIVTASNPTPLASAVALPLPAPTSGYFGVPYIPDPAPTLAPESAPVALSVVPEEDEPSAEIERWSIHACWRLVSHNPDAFNPAKEFITEQISTGSDGLYPLHADVRSSLQAHLRSVQKKEWDGVRIPSTSGSPQEQLQARNWERVKPQFAALVSKTIVPDVSGKAKSKLAPGEMTETFAFKLYHWMQECRRMLVDIYNQRAGEATEITAVLSLIGLQVPHVATGKALKHQQYDEQIFQGLWNIYQDLHMTGKNSSVAFIKKVANGLKAKNNGVVSAEELYYAMDIFRKLPFFGKEGELMNAIELATLAISQQPSVYTAGVRIPPVAASSKEAQTLAFIQRKIPLTSRRRVYSPKTDASPTVSGVSEEDSDEDEV